VISCVIAVLHFLLSKVGTAAV